MNATTNNDKLGVHGHFTDENDRVAYGLYNRPIMQDSIATHISQTTGDNSPITEAIRRQSDTDSSADELETIANQHPVWSVEVPNTIIHMEVGKVWRDTWDALLTYTDNDAELRNTINAPEIPNNSRVGMHYIDGQDMHLKTKLFGMSTADSFRAAATDYRNRYSPMRCPSNWEFEMFTVTAEHKYDSDTFTINPEKQTCGDGEAEAILTDENLTE